MNRKALNIYLISLGIIAVAMFSGLFYRSNKSREKWEKLEISGQINDFVHYGKEVFILLDTFWFSVNYTPFFEKENPVGCMFEKKPLDDHYLVNCSDSKTRIWSGSGGVVEDKIVLRRIGMALKKKERKAKL